ncbi:Sim4 complex subunit mis6 [Hyphodiscus hymeniophilus]|uniref:Sim4 complex subunit mis6 n=1 Tax=Hyphodiscus hymeniophilus TaxID=353542 RepID=A0A9P6VIJ4_9HELO|nr:Sim4 complex subunit mis6 [Hyphodiscus hymeniophilus]
MMPGQPKPEDNIEELLVDLERAAKTPAKQRVTNASSLIAKLCLIAYEDGLSSAALEDIIDIITLSNHLDQASTGSLIKNLYPVGKVQDSVVFKVVGSLGHGKAKPSFTVQAALLKWLVMTYDILDHQRVLSKLYSVLFNLLDTIAIRMELTRQVGNDPPLVALMRVYKDYYPDVIVGDVTTGRASVFTHPNPEWRQRLGEIQDVNLQRTQDGQAPEQQNFRVTRRGLNGSKRQKTSLIPEVHTSHAQESSVTLEEVENVTNFVNMLERIELPNQLVAAIGDPLLQKLLQLKPSTPNIHRMDQWLLAFFEDQLETLGSERAILEMLEAIQIYTHHTKRLPAACSSYLRSILESWNGIAGRQVILDLLTYTPIASWEELYESTFQPMQDAILDDERIESKLDLLTFYKTLLQRWALLILSEPDHYSTAGLSITSLITHANTLALSIIQTSQMVGTCSIILDFFEATTSLICNPALITKVRITIPPAELVYTLFFTTSLSTLSRLCATLALYKRAFELAMAPKAKAEQNPYPKDYVNHFNSFLMDLCNCLWRSRAFNTSDVNALGCLLPEPSVTALANYVSSLDTSLSLSTLFSLSYSPLICLSAISYLRELEDKAEDELEVRHAGPVTQSSLKILQKDGGLTLSWPDYRLGVLQYLERLGAPGVGELLYNTMKHLMAVREKTA